MVHKTDTSQLLELAEKQPEMDSRDVAKDEEYTRNIFVIVFIHGFVIVRVNNGLFY